MIKKYPAPHIHKEMNITQIYPRVLISLIPCAVAAVYYYGVRALLLIAVGMASFLIFDYLFIQFVRRETYVFDVSGLVSGAIFALILPSDIPVLYLIAGTFFGSFIVKQCFGGVGGNLLNPALAARAFLSIAFPVVDTYYAQPVVARLSTATLLYGPVDAISSATPWTSQAVNAFELFSGRYPGAIGTTCAIAILIGGAYLLRYGIIRLHAPMAYLFVLCGGYWLVNGLNASPYGMFYWIFTGGILFAAIFVMGDYTTTPTTKYGRLLFGAGAAILTLATRYFGNPSYSVGFSILAMNAVTPVLDLYVRPRIFGLTRWFSKIRPVDVNEEELP